MSQKRCDYTYTWWHVQTIKGPFIATQLNSAQLDVELSSVELSCVGEVSIATPTQLNSIDLLRADWLYASTGSVALPIVGDSWVASVWMFIATQLNSTRRRVELSCVAINGPLYTNECRTFPPRTYSSGHPPPRQFPLFLHGVGHSSYHHHHPDPNRPTTWGPDLTLTLTDPWLGELSENWH